MIDLDFKLYYHHKYYLGYMHQDLIQPLSTPAELVTSGHRPIPVFLLSSEFLKVKNVRKNKVTITSFTKSNWYFAPFTGLPGLPGLSALRLMLSIMVSIASFPLMKVFNCKSLFLDCMRWHRNGPKQRIYAVIDTFCQNFFFLTERIYISSRKLFLS